MKKQLNPISLSVIIPALNEMNNIQDSVMSTLKAFEVYDINGDIIVINDGSTDETPLIVRNIMKKNRRVKLINHSRPMGIGYSFFDGAGQSTKDAVIMIPGDNENNPEDALAYLNLLKQVDIVVPFIHNIEVRKRGRRILSSLYRLIINITFGINLNYTNGTVLYRRCILNGVTLKSWGFFYQAELLIKLIRKGYMFAEVPNFLSTRSSGKSKATTFKSLFRITKSYLNLAFEIHVKRIEGKKNYFNLIRDSISYGKSIRNSKAIHTTEYNS
jgi:glycosyltransferase involved in cell wall biosynthesis